MNIEKGFRFVFQEKNWLAKIVVGGVILLFSLLIIPIFIYYGYLVEVTKRTIREEQQLLPEWDEIGKKLANGFKLAIVIIVYLIPFFVLLSTSSSFLNLEIENFRGREIVAFSMAFLSSLLFGESLNTVSLLLIFISLVYVVFLILLFPFIIGKFAENGSINDAFAISDIFSMFRANVGDAIIVLLLTMFLQILASLGFALCFIGILLTSFWASVVQYYLYGELYKKAKGTGTKTITAT